ncbi:phage/plasmid primase, P4 family [Rothia sp. LK2588]|uniref:phage/plasmid primase, P4 family n=1 Tax=Rothia sp. LK2588 TaxID=3114369 RepID=UPI0034CEA99F
MSPTHANIQATAQNLHKHHINIIPTLNDHTKRPALTWKHYQTNPNTTQEINTWFGNGNPHNYGLAIITGRVSGNLEMAEIEGKAIHRLPEIAALAEDTGLGALWARLTTAWTEQSPSGGIHWIYKVDPTIKLPGNTKLARKHNPNATPKWEVLTETRAEGGYFVTAPTTGDHHETGRPWTRLTGGPDTITTLTNEEREAFHALLASIGDEEPEPEQHPTLNIPTTGGHDWTDGAKPGEDFELRTTWDEIIGAHGWTRSHTAGHTTYWVRPGKKPGQGFSATTGRDPQRDRLYVFTTSTEFEPETPYTKFGAYALLNHGGDYSAAARALAKDGYGKEPAMPAPTLADILPATRKDTNQWNNNDSRSQAEPTGETSPTSSGTEKSNQPQHTTAPSPASNATENPTEPDTSSPTPTAPDTTSPTSPGDLPLQSDEGNAQLLIHQHGNRLRYNHTAGRWYVWTGNKWEEQPTGGGLARELAKQAALTLPTNDQTERNWKKKSLSAMNITNTLKSAQTNPRIATTNEAFDNNPYELNTPAGIVNLRTGHITEPNPENMHTRITTTSPDPEADQTPWTNFLNQTFPNDQEMIGYIQRLSGYSLVGKTREHILPFAYGSGANGKSVFMDTIAGILGDYAGTSPNDFLMANKYQQHTTEIARLSGMRWVNCSEVNEHDRFDEAKTKLLTGGDKLTARFMRQDNFEFTPTHHLWLAGNFLPSVESGGEGFWRRLRIIPFVHTVPKDQRIPDLQGTLQREHGPAILAWLIEGARMYFQDGLQEPDRVKAATEEYEESQDTVARFIEDMVDLYPGNANYTAEVSKVSQEYEAWCRAEGEEPVMGRSFAKQLSHHGVLTGRMAPRAVNGGRRVYGGLRLKSDQDRLDNSNSFFGNG